MYFFNTPEFFLILLNLFVLVVAYFFFYPKFVGSDSSKLGMYDFVISVLLLILVGVLYYGSGVQFTFVFFETNWFWYQCILYFILELPFYFYYTKQNGIKVFDDLG